MITFEKKLSITLERYHVWYLPSFSSLSSSQRKRESIDRGTDVMSDGVMTISLDLPL